MTFHSQSSGFLQESRGFGDRITIDLPGFENVTDTAIRLDWRNFRGWVFLPNAKGGGAPPFMRGLSIVCLSFFVKHLLCISLHKRRKFKRVWLKFDKYRYFWSLKNKKSICNKLATIFPTLQATNISQPCEKENHLQKCRLGKGYVSLPGN